MDIESSSGAHGVRAGMLASLWVRVKGIPVKAKDKAVEFGAKVRKLGQDDPRRVIHSLKVGLALTLVSLVYYIRPFYDGYGISGMWAVLTVVVVFEFTAGELGFLFPLLIHAPNIIALGKVLSISYARFWGSNESCSCLLVMFDQEQP